LKLDDLLENFMTVSLSKQIKLDILVLAVILTFSGLCARAAEYHPDFMLTGSEMEYTRGGSITTESGVLNLQSPINSTGQVYNKALPFSDGTISVDARFSKNADPVQSHLGVMFNRVDSQSFWSLQINPSGKFMIGKCVNNVWQYIHPSSLLFVLKRGNMVWNTLSVQIKGSTLKVFVNGTEAYSGAYTSVAGGKVGLLSQDPGSADFKNWKVTY